MSRKPIPQSAATRQLGLPFVQQGPAHDLSYYIGICTVFATYHKRWPTRASTRDEFRAARILGYDGRRIEREIRYPGPELEADPAYRALRDRSRAEGQAEGVELAMLDPRYRNVMADDAIAALLDALTLAGGAAPGEVRYATGIAAHGPDEMTLRAGEAIRARAVDAAGLDADDPEVLRLTFAVRVRASDELKQFIDRTGMAHRSADGPLADHYRIDASDEGLLYVRYRMREGDRYAGRFDVDRLTARLASALAARPGLARARDRRAASADPAAPAPAPGAGGNGDDELRRQLQMLVPDGRSLKLPIQELSRLPDIRDAIQRAGGLYQPLKQRFDFSDDVAAAEVLKELLARRAFS